MTLEYLHVTSMMHRARYLVLVNDRMPVFLPLSRFDLLVKALICRVTKPQGCMIAQDLGLERTSFYQVITRFRNDFGGVFGDEIRRTLISNPGNGRYRLELDGEHITIDPGLEDLVPSVLAAKDLEILLENYHVCSRGVDVKSARNFYDSVPPGTLVENSQLDKTAAAVPEKPMNRICVDGTFRQNLAFLNAMRQRASERFGLAVYIEVACLDADGVARAVVSNVGELFSSNLKFRFCAPEEVERHLTEFLQAQSEPALGDKDESL